MKKELLDYLNGVTNAVRDEFILSREKSGDSELLYLSHQEFGDPLYTLWSSAKSRKRKVKKSAILEPIAVEKVVEVKPKNTGGKKPYTMIMEDQPELFDAMSIEASGLVMKLIGGGHIEWHTGRLIRKRDKKSMTYAMFLDLNIKPTKLRKAMVELSKNKIISYSRKERAYFISRGIAKKGGGKGEG